jgi:diguanylate cyclase (GGDEF)-like protein/PAS domain S-box-containing protein
MIPAITVGGLIGKWAAFIVGFGMLVPNYLLLQQLDSMGPSTIDFIGLVVAHITLGAVGYVYGDLYQVRHQLATELAERRSSDTKFRNLFESTRDSVIICDMDLFITDVNDEALRMLGYSRKELIGAPYGSIVEAEEQGDVKARASQAAAGVRLPFYERTYIRKDGQRVLVEMNGALVRNSDGTPSHFQAIGRDITKRKAAEQELYNLATHDQLTGLFNRAMFIELVNRGLERSRRDKKQMAILFIDLDKFKSVNDTHGHLTGDMLLRECAKRLTGLLRKSDVIARVGGDEFTVMVEPIEEKKYAQKIAKNIEASLGAPIIIDGKELDIAASVGMSYFPDDATDAETLLGKADQLMYGEKHDRGLAAIKNAESKPHDRLI